MHWLFSNDHLVHEICSHIPQDQLSVVSRISSTWFRCAVSRLYSNTTMQKALGPLGKTVLDDKVLQFVAFPSDEDFMRLPKYTIYVRDLSISKGSETIVLQAMRKCVSKDMQYLFPNTRNLTWIRPKYTPECMEVAIGLISPNIQRLSLQIDDCHMFYSLSPLMTTRLSALNSLTLVDLTDQKSSLEKPVRDILTFFSETLRLVEMSLSLNAPSIAQCLSKMPNLCSLSIGEYYATALDGRAIYGDGEIFPSLFWFSFDGTPQSFHDMFLHPYGLAALTKLSLNVEFTPGDVQTFILSIVVACPGMKILVLGDQDSQNQVWPVVPWAFVQPISTCKALNTLLIKRMLVSVNGKELTDFLKTRTTWQWLHVITSSPLRLEDIVLIYSAKHCPHLERLAINIDNTDVFFAKNLSHVTSSESDSDLSKLKFPALISIDFSCSNLQASGASTSTSHSLNIARFLYQFLEEPPSELKGLDEKVVDDIWRNLASLYIERQRRRTQVKPISNRVASLLQMIIRKKAPA